MPRLAKSMVIGTLLSCLIVLTGAWGLSASEDSAKTDSSDVSVDGPVLLQLNPPIRANRADAGEAEEETREAETESEPSPAGPKLPLETPSEKPTRPAIEPKQAGSNPAAEKKQVEKKAEEKAQPEAAKTEPEPEAKPPLSEDMVKMRDYVRRTLGGYFKQKFNTRDNTAADVLDACLAFGCDAEIQQVGRQGGAVNGFTSLCWNYPCAGYRLLKTNGDRIVARVGYGLQQWPSQFLAVLAQARVPANYPIRVAEDVRSVQDLVEAEKLNCRSGEDLSLKLIGLMRYVPDDAPWKNDLGETWSKERLVKEVLDQPVEALRAGGVHRLMALSYAVDRRIKREKPVTGQYLRAQKYVDEFIEYALELQNADGSWHPAFFAYRGSGGTPSGRLRSTGHILEWLVFSLPEERLQDPRIVRSVGYVGTLLNQQRQRRGVAYGSSRQIGGRMHALHALMVYDRRVFKPHDEVEAPAEEETDAERAERTPQEGPNPEVARLPKI